MKCLKRFVVAVCRYYIVILCIYVDVTSERTRERTHTHTHTHTPQQSTEVIQLVSPKCRELSVCDMPTVSILTCFFLICSTDMPYGSNSFRLTLLSQPASLIEFESFYPCHCNVLASVDGAVWCIRLSWTVYICVNPFTAVLATLSENDQ